MHTISSVESQRASGGILWSSPAMLAIMDSAALGPLVFAFGAGYAVGTFLYDNYMSE